MIEMDERNAWNRARHILLVGPGGAGKSSLGSALEPLLGRQLIDLDEQFTEQIGNIGAFIRDEGYGQYKLRNSALATEIVDEAIEPMLLVTSSGFLTSDNPAVALEANNKLCTACYSICLLPSRDLEEAVRIIVERQLKRPFSRDRTREERVIRERFPVYASLGDLIVFAAVPSDMIARAVADRLSSDGGLFVAGTPR